MSEFIFVEKEVMPDEKSLKKALGKSYSVWQQVKKHIKTDVGETTEEWKFYGKKYGWNLKTLLKKRNLFFFIPYSGYFTIGFVFGDKAVAAAEESGIPEELKETLRNARKYAEGRGLSLEVRDDEHLESIKELLRIKINN